MSYLEEEKPEIKEEDYKDEEDDAIDINKNGIIVSDENQSIKDEVIKTDIQEVRKEDDETDDDDTYDEKAFELFANIITNISQNNLSKLKGFLISKESKSINYFNANPFIKEGFTSIKQFLFDHQYESTAFSSFFAFKDILTYIQSKEVYKKIFDMPDDVLKDKINLLSGILESIIKSQMQKKKSKKNRKNYLKRKEKSIELKVNLGLIPKEVLEIKRQERLIETGAIGSMLNNKRDRDNLI